MLEKIWIQIRKERKIFFSVMYNTYIGLEVDKPVWASESTQNVKISRKCW